MPRKNQINAICLSSVQGDEQYRLLFNHIPDAVVIADYHGWILNVNEAACQLFGYPKKELLSMSIKALHPKASRRSTFALFKQIVKRRSRSLFDIDIITKGGQVRHTNLNVNLIESAGQTRLMGIFRDVTEKKETERRYETLAKMANDSIYLLNKDGVVIYVNEFGAKQLNAKPAEIIGQKIKALFPPAIYRRQKNNLDQVFKTGRPSYYENLSSFSFRPVWLSTKLTPIKDQRGGVESVMGLSRNISESYAIQTNLKQETSLLNSITQTSLEGILVISKAGKVVFCNQQFLNLWKIPNRLASLKDDKKLLAYVVSQLAKPKEFLAKVNYLYRHPSLTSSDQINFKDGRVFDRQSIPQSIDGKIVGRVWRFNDITENQERQNQLVLSEQKYRRLFEAAKDGILILDAETGEIREVNPYLIQMLGYSHKEFLKRKLWEIGLFKDIVASKESFEQLKRKKYIHYENLPLRTKSGMTFHVEFVSNVYLIDHTKVVQCNIRDITARYEAEENLANNEARFRAIYENSPVPIFLIGLDGRFLNVNLAAVKMLQYSQKELQKLTFGDITHPEEVKRDVAKVKELISGKISNYDMEKRYLRKDKKIIYVHISATLVRDVKNKPAYFLTIVEDVTDHHEYLERIRQSEIKYSTLVENSNDAVLVIQDGLYKFANKSSENITGYKAKEVLGKPLIDFVSPKDKKRVMDIYVKRMRGEQVPSRYEFEVVKRDGSLLPIEVSSSVVEFDGQPAVMAIIRDITKAREIDRVKSEFISVASHQLRGPLTGIKWFSQLLIDEKAGKLTPKQFDFLRQVYNSNERMISLVNDLLDVSRIETGQKFVLEKKPGDIVILINNVIKDQRINLPVENISIKFDRSFPDKLVFNFDQGKIYQAFSNLISNSIKYSGKDKKIIIGLKRLGDKVEFFVKDFGFGIPQNQQSRVFQKFFRADNTANISTEGTGLGLYIVKGIVEAHGGKVWFESAENKGTTFYIVLPLKNQKNPDIK
ncbi:MAG: PAS domain S-box protein [Candidatus Buchananbacteria bacterium]